MHANQGEVGSGFSKAGVSDAQVRVATANEALSAIKQASPVRPLDAQRKGCSGVVDATAGLRQAKPSDLLTQPLSSDRQGFEERVGSASMSGQAKPVNTEEGSKDETKEKSSPRSDEFCAPKGAQSDDLAHSGVAYSPGGVLSTPQRTSGTNFQRMLPIRKSPELQDQLLSPDQQMSGGFPHQVRIDENANEVIEIRAQGRSRPVDEKRQVHALPGYSVPMSKEEKEQHDKWLEEQMTKELEGEDGASSP